PAFAAKRVDGISPVTSEFVSLRAKGIDSQIVALADTSAGADVILANSDIASIQQLKGRRVGVQSGGVGHFFLLQVLNSAGLVENDVRLVELGSQDAATAWQTNQVDACYSGSPFSDAALKVKPTGKVLASTKDFPTAIADLYVFHKNLIESN
ncbi:ABC transporter substrate-binding protein, partial [Pediococcus acidilactici]|uniref:ABC transporter substrate-binding protein n=1 Tax=Pediococcus acidilactici TaxID=1254 RepID=UPI00318E74B4